MHHAFGPNAVLPLAIGHIGSRTGRTGWTGTSLASLAWLSCSACSALQACQYTDGQRWANAGPTLGWALARWKTPPNSPNNPACFLQLQALHVRYWYWGLLPRHTCLHTVLVCFWPRSPSITSFVWILVHTGAP